jgi:hypothetical protein
VSVWSTVLSASAGATGLPILLVLTYLVARILLLWLAHV